MRPVDVESSAAAAESASTKASTSATESPAAKSAATEEASSAPRPALLVAKLLYSLLKLVAAHPRQTGIFGRSGNGHRFGCCTGCSSKRGHTGRRCWIVRRTG